MKLIRDILLIFTVFVLLSQISSGVIQSQKVESVLPPTDEGLYSTGWTGGHYVTGQDYVEEKLVDVSEYVEIAVGAVHALGIKADGTLWAWGSQGFGRLGNGLSNVTAYITTPIQIGTDTDWLIISAGADHSAAIKTDGTLWTWGNAANGRLGNGTITPNVTSPTQIGSDTDWNGVSCGGTFTAAVKDDDLVTTGNNASYATGLNTNIGNTTSFTVADTTGWTKCYAGFAHGIGFKDNELWSWGLNTNGRTGQGTTSGSAQVPAQTTNTSTGWLTGSAGSSHSLAIKTDGTIHYMGNQTHGRLGNGSVSAVNISSVTQFGTDTDWELVGINGHAATTDLNEQSYAIKDGKLYVCGKNSNGQLGIDPTVTSETGDWTLMGVGTNYTRIGAGNGFALGIRKN